jgi:tRNA modification GTPase
MVELSCHGSPVILEEVVRLGIGAGARQADPGEFTLRAFLEGRIDILQAEAVNDLINASSPEQARLSFGQLKGSLSKKVAQWRSRVVDLISQVEAGIEFPEEELGISPESIARSLETVLEEVKALISSFETGRTMIEGVSLAITGRANVGKSTLFNALLDEERAIVSPYRGTTRDYLREGTKINGALFQVIDMAGLDRPFHPVDRKGIKKSWELASGADGILLVLDASRPLTRTDCGLLERFKEKKLIVVFNKADLPRKIDPEKFPDHHLKIPRVEISALKGTNLDRLRTMIGEVFVPERGKQEEMIFHLWQKLQLEQIRAVLERALDLLRQGHSEEVFAEEIRRSLPEIGRLTGEIRADEVIENIFSRFCVGK